MSLGREESLRGGQGTSRAFLSYSSNQRNLVQAVAGAVGRPFVQFDFVLLDSGDDIVDTLEEGIGGSGIFVLFASREALASPWVAEEVRQARVERITGKLKKILVFLLDDTLTIQDLPTWLRRQKVAYARGTRPLARAIRHAIDEVVHERQHAFFVGRREEVGELERALVTSDGSEPPRGIAVTGLNGIGRRTIARRAARDLLQLDKWTQVDVETGDSLLDLAAKFADQFEDVSSREESRAMTLAILNSDEEMSAKRISSNLEQAMSARELVILYDKGGLLDNEGRITDPVRSVLSAVPPLGLIALVTNRRPARSGVAFGQASIPTVRIHPLEKRDVRSLISLVANSLGMGVDPTQIAGLTDHVAGFPPSVYFALEMMRHYGPETVLAVPRQVVDFRVAPILRYIRSVQLPGNGPQMLSILAGNSPLPLPVLAKVLGVSEEDVGEDLMSLIDAALVEPDGSGFYRVSEPVVAAVTREFEPTRKGHYKAVADALDEFLADVDGEGYLTLSRVMFRALLLSGQSEQASKALSLSTDFIQAAERLYHRRAYENAAMVAEVAIAARPQEPAPRMILIKALAKLGKFDDGVEEIEHLNRRGYKREAEFHRGFLERHRGAWKTAIGHFEAALRSGFRGVSIHRELANCYVEVGELDKARSHIDQAGSASNRYIVDLMIRIACLQGDEQRARDLLEVLEAVDDPVFVNHRRSRVEALFGDPERAYQYAVEAMRKSQEERPPFEAIANRILCEIKTDRFDEANRSLEWLQQIYPRFRSDIRIGMESRLAISQGRFRDALDNWERLEDKRKPVHSKLRRDAIEGLLKHTALASEERRKFKEELERLERALAGLSPAQLDLL